MRIAYLTLDEVNANTAEQLATRAGQTVCQVDLRSPHLLAEPFLVLDLDHLPAEELPRLLALLLDRPCGKQAVHGYNLQPATARQLIRAGVVARRRLDATLFRRLRGRRGAGVIPAWPAG